MSHTGAGSKHYLVLAHMRVLILTSPWGCLSPALTNICTCEPLCLHTPEGLLEQSGLALPTPIPNPSLAIVLVPSKMQI